MEQLLKKFLNDNSVCVGLCDLQRKVDPQNEICIMSKEVEKAQKPVTVAPKEVTVPKQEVKLELLPTPQVKFKQVMSASEPKQSLAQKFAEQQHAYALQQQQAYIAAQQKAMAQKKAYQAYLQAQMKAQAQAQQLAKIQNQAVTEQRPVYMQERHFQKIESKNNVESYIQKAPQQANMMNGKMKGVVSAATARY